MDSFYMLLIFRGIDDQSNYSWSVREIHPMNFLLASGNKGAFSGWILNPRPVWEDMPGLHRRPQGGCPKLLEADQVKDQWTLSYIRCAVFLIYQFPRQSLWVILVRSRAFEIDIKVMSRTRNLCLVTSAKTMGPCPRLPGTNEILLRSKNVGLRTPVISRGVLPKTVGF